MQADVVCYYADLGKPYRPLLEKMCASVRKTMPGARLVCMTPTWDGDLGNGFDMIAKCRMPTVADNLCIERVRATCSWATKTDRPVIFTDPDIEFKIHPAIFDGIGLMWRTGKSDQPINTGIFISTPGNNEFWHHYGRVAVNLPRRIHHWYCDQLAFALLTGVCHKPGEVLKIDGSDVYLMDGDLLCPKLGLETPKAWAVHSKGRLKGEGWEKVFVSTRLDAGTSSQAS